MRTTYTATTIEAANLHSGKQTAIVTMVKPQPKPSDVCKIEGSNTYSIFKPNDVMPIDIPYTKGTRIIVREAWQTWVLGWIHRSTYGDKLPDGIKWRSPATMPRESARTELLIGETICVRAQDVSAEQYMLLGGDKMKEDDIGWWSYRRGFQSYLEHKFGPNAWADNPFLFITKVEKI